MPMKMPKTLEKIVEQEEENEEPAKEEVSEDDRREGGGVAWLSRVVIRTQIKLMPYFVKKNLKFQFNEFG